MAGTARWFSIGLMLVILTTGCVFQRKYNAQDIYERGLTAYYAGNYTQAAGDFRWAIDLKKEYSGPMLGLAQCQLHFAQENFDKKNTGAALHNLEEGLHWINLALDADPGNPQVTAVRTEILKMKGDIEQGVRTAQWGVKVQGPSAANLLLLARKYEEVGAYDEAEVAYKQAVAVEPNNIKARTQAAQFYEKIGKKDQALQQYEEAYRLNPTDPEIQVHISDLSGGQTAEPQSP